ncbi:hypothetical protein DBR32_09715 [Taibaiella sp. KBW10]|uniref:hypothetical protein n=1 Tax=Taibaiella sp. KBW10 TaxID=2153357 RepID=UPI000F5A90AB|nr:hypothetical protein [Taibaiella sp. KBW10]RQO30974.1 hypothetical protein DBR32_09715 [Taibaiella sp. KBW10]
MLPVKVIDRKPVQSKSKYLSKIFEVLSEEEGDDFDLIISIEQYDISFRDFSHFLITIDHFYGRFYKKGFLSYAMSPYDHLRASEIRQGSIEIIIEDILKKISLNEVVYFFLMIKYLPAIFKETSEAIKNITEAWNNYENARKVRLERKNLSKELRKEELLKNLSDDEIRKLTRSLINRYANEKKSLKKAARFAAQKLLDVKFRKRKS